MDQAANVHDTNMQIMWHKITLFIGIIQPDSSLINSLINQQFLLERITRMLLHYVVSYQRIEFHNFIWRTELSNVYDWKCTISDYTHRQRGNLKLIVIKCRFNYFNNWQRARSQRLARGSCCIFIRSWEPRPWGLCDLHHSQCLQAANCIQPCIYIFSLLPLAISSSIICTACQATNSQGHVLDISFIACTACQATYRPAIYTGYQPPNMESVIYTPHTCTRVFKVW